MAALLAKLGAEALRPRFAAGHWHKAAISAKNQARLRKEALLDGRDWFGDTGAPVTPPKRRKPKGHHFEREAAIRQGEIAANMQGMEQRIAAHRESRQLKNDDLFDQLTMTNKQRRVKQRG